MHAGRHQSGIERVGELAWGSHFCQFHNSIEDLKDSVLPYFQAGLEHRQRCLWVTSASLSLADARQLLSTGLRDFDRASASGQVEIIDEPSLRAHEHPLVTREDRALAAGFSGLRIAGLMGAAADAHEKLLRESLGRRRIVALCSYSLADCGGSAILDVVKTHDFALLRRDGHWEQIESAVPRNKELEAALRVRDEFLSIVSHELKTPLASLQLYLDGLRRLMRRPEFDVEEGARRIHRSLEQCDRLGHLLDNLLDVSRVRSGRLTTNPEEVDLSAVIRSICDHYRELAARDERDFVLDLPPDLYCRTDRLRIEQVMSNLISNVLKHAPGSPVYVTLSAPTSERIVISVRDQGPGILPAQLERIFDQFGETAEKYSAGLALGLWITRQVVEALEGTIRVISHLGKGTELIVDLPRYGREVRAS